jgi:hypothetical protein
LRSGGPREAQGGRQAVEVRQALVEIRVPVLAVDQDGAHPERPRALDVLLERVADHDGILGRDGKRGEGRLEDRGMRLDAPVRARVDDRVHIEAVVCDERVQVADAVGDDGDAEPGAPQLFEHWQDVLEELEVLRHAPAFLDLRRALARDCLGAAHADEDLLGEAVPDRLVVQQLRMPLEVDDRRLARIVVAARVESDAVPRGDTRVAIRGELGPGTAEREVDVEENGAQ